MLTDPIFVGFVKSEVKKLTQKSLHRRVYRNLLSIEDSNRLISKALESAEPFLVSRLGSTESKICRKYLLKKSYSAEEVSRINNCAGVFPGTRSAIDSFARAYVESVVDIDLLGTSYPWGEGFLIETLGNRGLQLVELKGIEPYYFSNPWSQQLEGKRVLVVHPFKDTILAQYEKRRILFETSILPEFGSLDVVRAVQSIGDGQTKYNDWLEAFEAMKLIISGRSFDVAIIGAGAYGLPLAAFIKRLGKIAVHMGGPTQVLFGIMGRRWDEQPAFRNPYNKNWVRPMSHETPENKDIVEGGCYW